MASGLENARGLYLEAIGEGRFEEGIERYAGHRYVQHSHPVPDGKDGFKTFFSAFVQREPDRRMDVVRGFQDGPLVFLHVVQVLGGEPTWVTMDIFDTDDEGRLVEHWDVVSAWEDPGGGASMVDGPTEPTEPHLTEDNKRLVGGFLTDTGADGDRYFSTRVLLGSGDLVAALSHARLHGEDSAVMDLFRVADGRIVEHWETREAIAPREEWVNTGKF